MARQAIIERTIKAINQLPENKAEEISDFVSKRYEEQLLSKSIQSLTADGDIFDFLQEEADLYSVADLPEAYNNTL